MALSSAEAEFIAGTEATKELQWITHFLEYGNLILTGGVSHTGYQVYLEILENLHHPDTGNIILLRYHTIFNCSLLCCFFNEYL